MVVTITLDFWNTTFGVLCLAGLCQTFYRLGYTGGELSMLRGAWSTITKRTMLIRGPLPDGWDIEVEASGESAESEVPHV